MSAEPIRVDRRHRRREETIEELVDVAAELMGEQGAAGLSLGEVARRMGIRTPSLYTYFDSKNALYDAVFTRGWQLLMAAMEPLAAVPDDDAALPALLLGLAQGFTRWAVEHPAYSQLMFWRPVPGYQPSESAYAPAVELSRRTVEILAALQARGFLRADVRVDELFRLWTMLIAGVVSQQLANAPDEPFDGGSFTSDLPTLVAMYLSQFAAPTGPRPGPRTKERKAP